VRVRRATAIETILLLTRAEILSANTINPSERTKTGRHDRDPKQAHLDPGDHQAYRSAALSILHATCLFSTAPYSNGWSAVNQRSPVKSYK
jgi:hypothetical protein